MSGRKIGGAIAVVAALVATGCAEEQQAGAGSQRDDAATEAPALDVRIDEPADGESTTRARVVVRGSVTPPDAVVRVRGGVATVRSDGRWSRALDLDLGENDITVRASAGGSTARANDTVSITRKRTAAQRAAYRAAQRRRRERRLANLRATARAVPPKQLQKSPDRYSGDTVVISGEIFQIQEDELGENFFLMNTECQTEFEIRICSGPTVHVAYDFSTPKTEEDFVTVYGTVRGGLDYETAIGGSNYVASVEAEIIE